MIHRIADSSSLTLKSLILAVILNGETSTAHADPSISAYDGGFMSNWQHNASVTQDEQPHWESLLGMASPRLTQGFRYNYSRQYSANGSTLENYGMEKGWI